VASSAQAVKKITGMSSRAWMASAACTPSISPFSMMSISIRSGRVDRAFAIASSPQQTAPTT
jgi:hypothetical protein